jgi:hypothetical protein
MSANNTPLSVEADKFSQFDFRELYYFRHFFHELANTLPVLVRGCDAAGDFAVDLLLNVERGARLRPAKTPEDLCWKLLCMLEPDGTQHLEVTEAILDEIKTLLEVKP